MATADYALSDSDSGSDAEFDVEYGGISENTLKFIGGKDSLKLKIR